MLRLAAAFVCLAATVAAADTPIAALGAGRGPRIAGTVTHVFGNRFVLEDATGAVLVETGPAWHARRSFTVGERLAVTGEPDDGAFDAFAIERADGRVETIRPAGGPPPWAGRD